MLEEEAYYIPSQTIATASLKEYDLDAFSTPSALAYTPDPIPIPTSPAGSKSTITLNAVYNTLSTSSVILLGQNNDKRTNRRFSLQEPSQTRVATQTITDAIGEPRECLLAPIGSYQTDNVTIRDVNYVYSTLHRSAWR